MGGEECIIQVHEEVPEAGESSIMAMAREWLRQTKSEVQELGRTRKKESERRGATSIYRIPWNLRKLNSKAYQPQVVSIGPYHHGMGQLKAMEEHKHRALLNFLERTGHPLEHYVGALAPEMQRLKDAYHDLRWKPGSFEFLKMMIVDGCFMLELMRWDHETGSGRYADNDLIFSEHGFLYLQPLLKRDMLMLENQIPLLVLVKLQLAAHDGVLDKIKEELRGNVLNFFNPPTRVQNLKDKSKNLSTQIKKWGDFLHILDLYRKSLLLYEKDEESPKTSCGSLPSCCPARSSRTAAIKTRGIDDDDDQLTMLGCHSSCFSKRDPNGMRSATELIEAGIKFKKSNTEYLNDMRLDGGSLKLPQVTVDATSQYMYLNLMAFERLHVGAGKEPMNEVTSYVFFMDRLIDTARDVALLHRHGVVENFLGSDDDVAKLFNRLSTDICPDTGKAFQLQKEVAVKYRKRVLRCLAFAKHNYCTNPWVTITIFAGIFIFLFTAAQTSYAILAYHHPFDTSSPSPSP